MLVEDLALGLFSAAPDGTPLGSCGDMSVFSLVKTLPLPDGGALWLKQPSPAALKRLRPAPLRQILAAGKGLLRRSLPPGPGARKNTGSGTVRAPSQRWQPRAGIRADDMAGQMPRPTRLLLKLTDPGEQAARIRRNYLMLQNGIPRTAALPPADARSAERRLPGLLSAVLPGCRHAAPGPDRRRHPVRPFLAPAPPGG